MFEFSNTSLEFSFDIPLFIIAAVILGGYTFFIYKVTLPQVNNIFKGFLIGLRILALLLILGLIFEPVLTLKDEELVEAENLVFIDNSKSILQHDSINTQPKIYSFLNELNDNSVGKTSFYLFDQFLEEIEYDSDRIFNFSGPLTNFENLFDGEHLKNKNISSITILSDGNINDGNTPTNLAEKLDVPVFTIGIGDTTTHSDIELKKVVHNNYVYAKKTTPLKVLVSSNNYKGETTLATLYEDGNQIEQKPITISGSGINNIEFDYTPTEAGEKKISVSINPVQGELNNFNNSKTIFINVLDTKLNILLLAGAASSDFSFIYKGLKSDPNYEITKILPIKGNKYLQPETIFEKVEDSDIMFLVGFPAYDTPENIVTKVFEEISNKNKSFFILVDRSTDVNKLNRYRQLFPFNIVSGRTRYVLAQPDVEMFNNPILGNGLESLAEWNSLPPVFIRDNAFKAKERSKVLSKARINNLKTETPLILTHKIGAVQSIAVLASDIWRWKMQAAENQKIFYDTFFSNVVKWLNISEDQKRIIIKPTKRLFTNGETIEFTAQIYDETFSPIENAEVKVNINSDKEDIELTLNSIGGGVYEGSIESYLPGDYQFTATAKSSNVTIGNNRGKFSVSKVELEKLANSLSKENLSLLSIITNGEFQLLENSIAIIPKINSLAELAQKKELKIEQINLWSNLLLMYILIFLFSMEWFLRKRSGML